MLRVGGARRGEEAEDEDDCERSAYDHHAATAVCWLSTAAIFRQPSILRNLICPLATRLKSKPTAEFREADPLGSPGTRRALARYRAGPGGGGGGLPGGGGGGEPARGGAFGASDGGRGANGGEAYPESEPRGTGIWLPLAYMHCMYAMS